MLTETLGQRRKAPVEADHQRWASFSFELRSDLPQFSLFQAERLLDEDCFAPSQCLERQPSVQVVPRRNEDAGERLVIQNLRGLDRTPFETEAFRSRDGGKAGPAGDDIQHETLAFGERDQVPASKAPCADEADVRSGGEVAYRLRFSGLRGSSPLLRAVVDHDGLSPLLSV